MAKKISELTTISSIDSSDVLPIVDVSASTTNKVLLDDLANAINEKANPVVLYNNTTGSNAEITLSDNSANYEYIEIFYRTSNNYYGSVKVYEPNGKNVSMLAANATTGYLYAKTTCVSISANTITPLNYSDTALRDNSNTSVNVSENKIYIVRVLGYE